MRKEGKGREGKGRVDRKGREGGKGEEMKWMVVYINNPEHNELLQSHHATSHHVTFKYIRQI